jgi:hypothetical protein
LLIGTRAQTLLRVKFNFGTQRRTYACVRAWLSARNKYRSRA